jgi:hypothetical protein
MKIFGYCDKVLDECGLMEMKEITFHGNPENLRRIAIFLQECAAHIEEDPGGFDHEHMSFRNPAWIDEFPEIVVAEEHD